MVVSGQNEQYHLLIRLFKTKLNQKNLFSTFKCNAQQYHNRIRDDCYISLKRTYPNSIIRIKTILKTSQHQFLMLHSPGVTTHAHLTAHTPLSLFTLSFHTHPLLFYKNKTKRHLFRVNNSESIS